MTFFNQPTNADKLRIWITSEKTRPLRKLD